MSLLIDFRDEARRRGALAPEEPVSLQSAFRVVRDLPLAGSGDDAPDAVLRAWRGTALGKHALLAALLDAQGTEQAIIFATHAYSAAETPWLPPALRDEVRDRPLPDVHTFLRVRSDPVADDWMTVDATWPLAAGALGLPVNERLTPGVDQRIACDVEEIVHVPEDEDPGAVRERILAVHAAGQRERRDRFVEALAAWLEAALDERVR